MDSEQLLKHLDVKGTISTLDIAKEYNVDHQKVIGIVKSILALGNIITADPVTSKHWELTDEGASVLLNGSYEVNIYNAVPSDGISQKELMTIPNAKIGFSQAMSKGWIAIDRVANKVVKKVDLVVDKIKEDMLQFKMCHDQISESDKLDYKKRKLIKEVVIKSLILGTLLHSKLFSFIKLFNLLIYCLQVKVQNLLLLLLSLKPNLLLK